MEDIQTLVSSFKEKTVKMISCFDTQNYDELNSLLKERQYIINSIQENLDFYGKKNIIKEFNNSDIVDIDKKVEKLINENLDIIKDKLKSINEKDFINKKYGNRLSGNAIFFNKKIY
ncbi:MULTISPECIES: flagellar protein FliT [Clostridium]|uniref:flagellar protein FliT n=1 Tax=Clostridium TaxID=1485 RepID=UPI00082561AD|nr:MULTISPECIES: flagellar protein FliT [Clostridium]PJI09829.1 flagellar protein FliT [Clostridium sp. CT7]